MKNLKMRSLGIGFFFTGALYVVAMSFALLTGRETVESVSGTVMIGVFLLVVGTILYFFGDRENRQRRMEERERFRLQKEEQTRRVNREWSDKGGAECEWR